MIREVALVYPQLEDSEFYRKNIVDEKWRVKILLILALIVAQLLHFGQVRRSGNRYVEHPQGVSNLAREMGLSPSERAAALLYDVIEESKGWRIILAILLVPLCGPVVLMMVVALTKWLWSKEEDKYYRQIDLFARLLLLRELVAVKMIDKAAVLGTPFHRSLEKTIENMEQVLTCFARFVTKCRCLVPSRHLTDFDKLWEYCQTQAQTKLEEARASQVVT